jgi:hypothetical protein
VNTENLILEEKLSFRSFSCFFSFSLNSFSNFLVFF